MDQNLAKFLRSDAAKGVGAETLMVYLHLRADIALAGTPAVKLLRQNGKLATILEPHTCADYLGIPPLTAERRFDELRRRGWMQVRGGVAVLGEFGTDTGVRWYADTEPTQIIHSSAADAVLRKAKGEGAAASTPKAKATTAGRHGSDRLPADEGMERAVAAKVFGLGQVLPGTVKKLRDHYVASYRKRYGEAPPDVKGRANLKAAHVYLGRALGHVGYNEITLFRFLDWVFGNWEAVRDLLHLPAGRRPSLKVLGNKSYFERMRHAQEHGFHGATEAGKRETARKAEKDYGWG
jgi:hypothetical protein